MATIFEEVASETRRRADEAVAEDEAAVLSTPPPGTSLPMADTAELRAAIEETPAHLLLPVFVQLTGDTAFLDRFVPHIRTMWEGGPQVPPELDRELRDRLFAVLTGPVANDAAPVTEAMLVQIMSTVAGEPIGTEFVPLLVEQMGFQPAGRFVPEPHRRAPAGYRVAVIGAGMSGIAAGIRLAASGYDYRIFEKAIEVGGVWWSNKYPGVAVDTPSHFYSYSYELNPDWPRFFSSGPVLMDYWKRVADKYGVRERVSFQTEVLRCRWDDARLLWTITFRGPDGVEQDEDYDVVISASGLFTHPEPPKVPGVEDFRGVKMHTAHWDPSLDVTGKRVIQIGTGASGVQAGPSIAPQVEHLTIFQRTAPWIMVRPDRQVEKPTPDSFRWGLRHIPHLAQWMRFYTYWWASDGSHQLIRQDPDWPASDTSVNALSEAWYTMFIALLKDRLKDRPDLIEKMIPNYPIMGKRILQDSKWTDTVMRDNVDLITTPIERVVPEGVRTVDGKVYPADVLILATGFAMTKMIQHIEIIGRGGVYLRDIWGEEDPRSYMGTLVPGFPNLFLINGPNSGATHGAGVNIYSEAQVNYILRCLDTLFERGARTIEPTQDAHDAYNEKVDAALEKTVWNHPNVTTYYRNSKGRNFISCPWRIVDMWHLMRAPKVEDLVIR